MRDRKPLGQLLLTRGLGEEHLARALAEQKRSDRKKLLGEVLIELRLCSAEQIADALAAAYGVPFARITPRVVDPKVIELLPRAFIEKHWVLPLFLVEGKLTVAVAEPTNLFLIEEVERLSGVRVQVVAATVGDIQATLAAFMPDEQCFALHAAAIDLHRETMSLIDQAVGDSPAAKLVRYCIDSAVKDGATEIHFELYETFSRIRNRVDGRLIESIRPPVALHSAIAARVKALAGMDAAQTLMPQEGSFELTIGGRAILLRGSTMPGPFGEKIVINLVYGDRLFIGLERLGLNYETLKRWRKLIALKQGLLLVTGPAGSGKLSTLYASLAEMNTGELNVCSVEDPIAYPLAGVNQFQASKNANFTSASTIESLLRHEPDVIMLSGLRDPELARAAAQAALGGRLVITTLPTPDAPSAITRLVNLGVEPYLVGATLTGVMAQRLVRKLCQACREPYCPSISEQRALEKLGAAVETLYRPRGCAHCRNLGYKGRIGIFELMNVDDVLSERVSQGASLGESRNIALEQGLKTLRVDGIEKVKAGITTMDEVCRVTA